KATLVDNLWVRILDVKAALEARTYSEDATVAFELTDTLLPENSTVWVMEIRDGMASVERGDRGTSPALSLGINELSAAYLGGTTVETLARAGSVFEVKAGSVRALSRAMRGDQAPVCNIGF